MTSSPRLVGLSMMAACFCLMMPRLVTAQQPEIATTVAFTEGPAADRDGNIYFTHTFAGPDMKTLYVTAGKTLYKVRTEIAGLPR